MEISASVKDVVETAREFTKLQSESNLTKLQRNLDAVNGLVSRDSSGNIFKVLDPGAMLGVECLSNISTLLSSTVRVRASLATRILQFLEFLVRDDGLRIALRTHFDFLASLSTFLQRHDAAGTPLSKDESTIRCLSLLQRITFGLDTRDESHRHLEFLVGLLVTVLLNNDESNQEEASSTSDSSLLLPSLALLANLSKNNPFVQSLVRNHVNIKAFYKRLIACLARKEDAAVVICAKSVFANLYLNNHNDYVSNPSVTKENAGGNYNDRLAEKLFNQSNIRQTFQLVLNCMQKASSSASSDSSSLFAQSYGVDLLHTLLSVPAFANCFLAYDHRDAFCRGFFDLLVHVHARRKTLGSKEAGFNILLRFLELIRLLSEFEELKTTLAAAATAGDPSSPPFFNTLVAIVESGPKLMTRSSLATAEAAVQVLERMRSMNASGITEIFTQRVIPAAAAVLSVLSERHPLNGQLPPQSSTLSSTINSNAPTNVASSSAPNEASLEAPIESLLLLASSTYRLLATVIHLQDAVNAFKRVADFDLPVATVETLTRRHLGASGADIRMNSIPWREAAIDVVLQALRFLAMARKVKGITSEDVTSHLTLLLADNQTLSLVAAGMTSRDRNRVSASVLLFAETLTATSDATVEFSHDQFADTLAGINAAKETHQRRIRRRPLDEESSDSDFPSKRPAMMMSRGDEAAVNGSDNKENVFSSFGQTTSSAKRDVPMAPSSETKVDVLLTRLTSADHAGEVVKDLRTSEILSVYEHKFKSLSMKENHLQDLLDAKALALAQADRLIAQYRCRKAESEVEMTRLRSLLHQSEKEAEKSRDLLNTARLDAERLQGLVASLEKEKTGLKATSEAFKTLQAETVVTMEKLEEAARNNQKLRQENKTLAEMTDMQKKHNESLRATNDNQAEQIAVLDLNQRRLKEELAAAKDAAKDAETKAARLAEEGEALEREKVKLEESIDAYRKKLDALERSNKEQKHQLSSLRVVVEKQEANIADKEKLNAELEQRLLQHAAMISMIQNITTGKK